MSYGLKTVLKSLCVLMRTCSCLYTFGDEFVRGFFSHRPTTDHSGLVPISQGAYFGLIITVGALIMRLCIISNFASSFVHNTRLPANMDAICWGKDTKPREPSNEHDPYTLAVPSSQRTRPIRVTVLKNLPGGAAGGYKPRPPFVAVGGCSTAGEGTQRRLDREELYESTQ